MNCYFCHNQMFKPYDESEYFECKQCLNKNIDKIRQWCNEERQYCINFFYLIGENGFFVSIRPKEHIIYIYDKNWTTPITSWKTSSITLKDIDEKLSLYLIFQ